MKNSWICRDHQDGDEYQLLTLYKEVNNKEMTLDHWKWKFTESPSGKAVIKLMFDGDKLIGHYAAIPMNMQVKNKLVKAVLSVNTMTHPDYRGYGIFAYLGKETYRVCEQKGFKFVYGFPNNNIYQSRIKKLGWKGYGKMSILTKDLESEAASIYSAKKVYEVYEFDTRVNLLWEKVKNSYPVIVIRTKEFLNWRFTNHPTVKYPTFIFQDSSDEVLGYLVLKIYTRGDEKKGHIVDLLCINETDIVKSFLSYSYNYFVEKGIKNISCWASKGSFYAQVLKQEGFIEQEFETYFGVRVLDEKNKLLRNVEQLDNWHLMMGDSDVF